MRLTPPLAGPVPIFADASGFPGASLAPPHQGHAHVWPPGLSRRRFLSVAAGSVAAGVTLGSGLLRPAGVTADDDDGGTARPIPGGSPGLNAAFPPPPGKLFHVYAPGVPGLDPNDAEPATITDFKGSVGLAYVSGMVTRTNKTTGEVRQLPFVDSDMRFMTGVFRGTDGSLHHGTYGLI